MDWSEDDAAGIRKYVIHVLNSHVMLLEAYLSFYDKISTVIIVVSSVNQFCFLQTF